MAVHCLASDQYGIIVTVGSTIDKNKSSGSRKEHNPPHAHVWSSDKKFHSRFQIVNAICPQKPEELEVVDVDKDAPLNSIADEIIKWANDKPKCCFQEGDSTNWDAMRSSWRDIQENVNNQVEANQEPAIPFEDDKIRIISAWQALPSSRYTQIYNKHKTKKTNLKQ